MDDTPKSIVNNIHNHSFKKHVTTACDACRRKRSKCDGLTPCPSCSSTGEPCLYSHNDRRRQRSKRNIIRSQEDVPVVDRDPAQSIPPTVQSSGDGQDVLKPNIIRVDSSRKRQGNEFHNGRDTAGVPKSELQCLAVLEADPIHRTATSSAFGDPDETATLSAKRSSRLDTASAAGILTMTHMQGKFEARSSVKGHNFGEGALRLPHRRLLPKDVSRSRPVHDLQDPSGKHRHLARQQQPGQLVWQLRRRGYAVPGYTRTFGNLPFSSAIKVNGYPASVQARQMLNFSAPEHLVFPLADADESPLGRAFTDFRQLGRRLIAECTSPFQVADQGLIDVTLFFRDRLPTDPVNASSWASEMLRAFKNTFSDQLLLACAVCVGSLMRWFLVPTLENYAQIPSIVRPTRLQRVKPHPPWVDLMIFPTFRNALVNKVRDWAEPCIKANWEFLWPHTLEEALIRDPHTHRAFLTGEFAFHVDNPKNWIIQKSILEDFPEVRESEMEISWE